MVGGVPPILVWSFAVALVGAAMLRLSAKAERWWEKAIVALGWTVFGFLLRGPL